MKCNETSPKVKRRKREREREREQEMNDMDEMNSKIKRTRHVDEDRAVDDLVSQS